MGDTLAKGSDLHIGLRVWDPDVWVGIKRMRDAVQPLLELDGATADLQARCALTSKATIRIEATSYVFFGITKRIYITGVTGVAIAIAPWQ